MNPSFRLIPAFILLLFTIGSCSNATSSKHDNAEDIAYLEENAKKEGVVVTESGLQYKIIEKTENDKPVPGDTVQVRYRGKLVSGIVFYGTHGSMAPDEFIVDEDYILPGFKEGLLLMPVGSRYEFVLPADLAYGDRDIPSFYIHSGATILLDVRLEGIR